MVDNSSSPRRDFTKRRQELNPLYNEEISLELNKNTVGEVLKNNDEIVKKKKAKKFPCYYGCEKTTGTTASRHYTTVHKDEAIIRLLEGTKPQMRARNSKLTDEQKFRNEIFEFLRKAAIDEQNLKAQTADEFLTERTPREGQIKVASDYCRCTICKGWYCNESYRKHVPTCKKRFNQMNFDVNGLIASRMTVGIKNLQISPELAKTLLKLRHGPQKDIIERDSLIINYGNGYAYKHRLKNQDKMIRARLRLIAELVIALNSVNPEIKQISDLFTPDNYDYLVPAINKIGKYDEVAKIYRTPAQAASAGAYVKELADLWITQCIKDKNSVAKLLGTDFLQVYGTSFLKDCGRTIYDSQNETHRLKIVKLPPQNDVKLYNTHTSAVQNEAISILKNGYNTNAYIELMESTMLRLQALNYRRAGDVENLKKSYYDCRERLDPDSITPGMKLSAAELQILKRFSRVRTRAKLDKTAPILFEIQDETAIEILYQYREEHGVRADNPYVFGMAGSDSEKKMSICEIIPKYAQNCGAEYPERLRGTNMRKYVSTLSWSMELTSGAREDLFSHLSHTEKTNKNYYNQQLFQKQVLNVAPVLFNVAGIDLYDEDLLNEMDPDYEDMQTEYDMQLKNSISQNKKTLPKSSDVNKAGNQNNIVISHEEHEAILEIEDTIPARKACVIKKVQNIEKRPRSALSTSEDEYIPLEDEYESDESQSSISRARKRVKISKADSRDVRKKHSYSTWDSYQRALVWPLVLKSVSGSHVSGAEVRALIMKEGSCIGFRNVGQVKTYIYTNTKKILEQHRKTMKILQAKLDNGLALSKVEKQKLDEAKNKLDAQNNVSTRNRIPAAILNELKAFIEQKRVPSTQECIDIINTLSPGQRNYKPEELQDIVRSQMT